MKTGKRKVWNLSDELKGPKIFRNSSGFDWGFVVGLFLKSHLSLPLTILLSLSINDCLLRDGTGQGLRE